MKIKRRSFMDNSLGLMGGVILANRGIIAVYEIDEKITVLISPDHISIKDHSGKAKPSYLSQIENLFISDVTERKENKGVIYLYGTPKNDIGGCDE